MLLSTGPMKRATLWFSTCVCSSVGCADGVDDDRGTHAAGSADGAENAGSTNPTRTLDNGRNAVPVPDCNGNDERAITGYALGHGCVAEKVIVPGVCATGAQRSASSGTGTMLCFVTADGDYYWAFVQYGESVTATGAKHGHGELFGNQLDREQSARCDALIRPLRSAPGASFNVVSQEFVAAPLNDSCSGA